LDQSKAVKKAVKREAEMVDKKEALKGNRSDDLMAVSMAELKGERMVP
jgi:hypothetical protein